MRLILVYVADYLRWINKPLLFMSAAALSTLIYFNYGQGIATTVNTYPFPTKFLLYYLLFFTVFTGCLLPGLLSEKFRLPRDANLYKLIVFSPAIFALKIALSAKQLIRSLPINPGLNEFLQVVAQWPIKAVPVVLLTAWLWKNTRNKPPIAGLAKLKADRVKPYLIMLLLMLPLVILAASFPDFQKAYPKLYLINTGSTIPFWKGLVFELSYGLDFFTIEFFFRGFLILAFARFAGRAAILPMAVFYCTIHFGKPLGECISSFFGGIILGAVVYNTRSIWGGLIVHLGIAWAMELAGVLI